MNTLNSIKIRGPIHRVFEFARRVEDWPSLLPHYRRVSVISDSEESRIVAMHCVRDFGPILWPCQWVARQVVLPDEWTIHFVHLAGPARGMKVEWKLQADGETVHATISHQLIHRLGPAYSDRIIGRLFVSAIASKTLSTLKTLVEAEALR